MSRLTLSVVVVLFALSCVGPQNVENQNANENESPPGYADVVIGPIDQQTGKAPVTIQSVEGPADGWIKCGRSPGDKCKAHSRITWSVQNNSGVDVRVVMDDFVLGERRESPFNQNPSRPRIPKDARLPVFENVKQNPTSGSYKYWIRVYRFQDGDTTLGELDPRIDI